MNEPIPHPVLLNTWKHHAGWIRSRIGQAVSAGTVGVDALPREMAVVGTRLMDLYTGSFTPKEIAEHVLEQLRTLGRLEYEPLARWLQGQGEYSMLDLPDGSKWTIRLGPSGGRYIHLHPGRWVPHTVRIRANTLKTAVMAQAHAGLTGCDPTDLAVVNEARRKYLNLLPLRQEPGEADAFVVPGISGPVAPCGKADRTI